MKLKICGLYREEDVLFANEVKPDFVGFVFYPPSHRNVTVTQARALKKLLDPRIPAVGVFVKEPEENILRLLEEDIIDLAQLHGGESEETVRRIQRESGKPVIKAVKVRSEEDVERWLDSQADYLLFDNGKGTGQTFDWTALGKIQVGRKFFLAGGIGPENIREAMELCRPWAIDVSSGAETNGIKDLAKMRALAEAVRGFGM